jgi:hypothetical protein
MLLALISLAGTLFSGYLTASKMVADVCPLNEGCPYLFGYPSCLYGFLIFFSLLVLSLLYLYKPKNNRNILKTIVAVSVFGIVYGVYFSVYDLFFLQCAGGQCQYSLLLPSCIYGTALYAFIFFHSFKLFKKTN